MIKNIQRLPVNEDEVNYLVHSLIRGGARAEKFVFGTSIGENSIEVQIVENDDLGFLNISRNNSFVNDEEIKIWQKFKTKYSKVINSPLKDKSISIPVEDANTDEFLDEFSRLLICLNIDWVDPTGAMHSFSYPNPIFRFFHFLSFIISIILGAYLIIYELSADNFEFLFSAKNFTSFERGHFLLLVLIFVINRILYSLALSPVAAKALIGTNRNRWKSFRFIMLGLFLLVTAIISVHS